MICQKLCQSYFVVPFYAMTIGIITVVLTTVIGNRTLRTRDRSALRHFRSSLVSLVSALRRRNTEVVQRIVKCTLHNSPQFPPEVSVLFSINNTHQSFSGSSVPGGITAHTHTYPFNGPFSGTTQVSRYQKGKNQSRFYWSKRQWVAVASARTYICKSAPHSRQITTPAPHRSVFLQAGCPFCRPTNSVKASDVLQRRMFITFRSNCHLHVTEGCTFCKSALSRWVRSVLTFWHQYRSVLP